jgi:hypothetical protein
MPWAVREAIMAEDVLTLARPHVMRGRQILADQGRRIFGREERALDATDQLAPLDVFESTLAIFEDHLKSILKQRGL